MLRTWGKMGCLVAAISAGVVAPAFADSWLDPLAKSTGLMATPPDPPDFVKASRPASTPSSIPVFATPEEPRSKVKSPAELKAMDDDLERARGVAPASAGGAKEGAHSPKKKPAKNATP